MTYQVLARKYRPQTFAEVVGQEHITTTLKNAITGSRLHHAYLFAGARGVGKTTIARILAKALNCTQLSGSEPCGQCLSCKEITNGNSLDVQEIDGASNTGVDDVRELREGTKYMPSSGKFKVYIIDEVHMLSGSAFNALLKTLEEPPKHVVFIFATTESHKIPATILSRCQRYDFRRIPSSAIATTLKAIAATEGVSIDDSALHLIAHEATGSLRDAESLFDQAIAFAGNNVTSDTVKSMLGFLDRKFLFDILQAVIASDSKKALAVLDQVFETGADISRFAMEVLEIIRHALVLSECKDVKVIAELAPDEVALLRDILKDVQSARLSQMFNTWYRVAEDAARFPFPKMLMEVGLIRLCRVVDVLSIDEVIAKIDAITGSTEISERPVSIVTASVPERSKVAEHVEDTTFDAQKKWQEFMRWVVTQRPQVASIFQHGTFEGMDDSLIRLKFDSPLYSDMLNEIDRKPQIEELLKTFFKKPLRLEATCPNQDSTQKSGSKRKEIIREALSNEIVRYAADILNAQVHDVKIEEK